MLKHTVSEIAAAVASTQPVTGFSAVDTFCAMQCGRHDAGNAERLIARGIADRVLFVERKPMAFDGRVWRTSGPTALGAVLGLMKHGEIEAGVIRQDARDRGLKDRQLERALERADKAADFATSSQNANRLKNALELLSTHLGVEQEAFDADPVVINTPSGVVDPRTGAVELHAPSQMITRITKQPYDPSAACPTWDETFEKVFFSSAEYRAFVRLVIGYIFSDHIDEQVVICVIGKGGGGKNAFLDTLKRIAGDYAGKVDPSAIIETKGAKDTRNLDTMNMARCRFVLSSELNEGDKLDEAKVKRMSGDEEFSAREHYGEQKDYAIRAKMLVVSNFLPPIRSSERGITRRILPVPFLAQFYQPNEMPAEPTPGAFLDQGSQVKKAIAAEHAGILNWIIECCRLYQEFREGGLKLISAMPAEVIEAKGRVAEGADPLAEFLERMVDVEPNATERVPVSTLFDHYRGWCLYRGLSPMSSTAFGRAMTDQLGSQSTKARVGKTVVNVRYGIRLRYATQSGQGPVEEQIRTELRAEDTRAAISAVPASEDNVVPIRPTEAIVEIEELGKRRTVPVGDLPPVWASFFRAKEAELYEGEWINHPGGWGKIRMVA